LLPGEVPYFYGFLGPGQSVESFTEA